MFDGKKSPKYPILNEIKVPPKVLENWQVTIDMMARLTRGETVNRIETTRLRKDGQLIHVALTISPITDACRQVTGISTIARDITERKQEKEMRKCNEELTLFNRAATGREMRMIDLKREINELCEATGQPPRYKLDFTVAATTSPSQ